MPSNYYDYIKTVDEGINVLIEKLDKHYPGIGLKVYETGETKSTFYDRMCFGIYIELLHAGYLKDNE